MPEGHTIHRAAQDQRPMLVGKRIAATSPQGRFADGAAMIDGRTCVAIDALGKHLLYHFDSGEHLHIHLGLAGRIYRSAQPADPPRDVVRIRMESLSHVIDITGPAICEILTDAELAAFRMKYGPDLLAEPDEPERAIARIRKSRSPIATLLMNQQVISGIGNIYRTEILWLLGLNPFMRGCDVPEETLHKLWAEMRALMQIGVKYNSIITNGELPAAGQDIQERVNIYAEAACPTCKSEIGVTKISARTLYYCARCQSV
ncbi:Fpg/Nei family DNA glycosylase [Tateyamaria sp. syn59]|uniref:Fpg/Nei family DNA glycosylase n=1 Tax=Tateyamaria sp. syn59 TaxID=2576942 RepID=UPI0011BFDD90|nr:DNA-formamidopyrimidine glycosylase family protein [Tateyamaria sp. syn59]